MTECLCRRCQPVEGRAARCSCINHCLDCHGLRHRCAGPLESLLYGSSNQNTYVYQGTEGLKVRQLNREGRHAAA